MRCTLRLMQPVVDSQSMGDPTRFLSVAELEARLAALPAAPTSAGQVALIVRKGDGGRRQTPGRVMLAPNDGVPGDAWGRKPGRHPEMALAVMQRDVAELIANGQPLTLFGDNVFVDLDLSTANLPAGSRLRAGDVELEVTPAPHDGCRKFRGRFGADALRFVAARHLRPLNLRGIYLRVVSGGAIACGDAIAVVSRPSAY